MLRCLSTSFLRSTTSSLSATTAAIRIKGRGSQQQERLISTSWRSASSVFSGINDDKNNNKDKSRSLGCLQRNNKNLFFQHQQVRWMSRHDGYKKSTLYLAGRPPTRKQRKKYNLKMKELRARQERHSAPGSKAGPRREWQEGNRQELLNWDTEKIIQENTDPEFLKYNMDDAVLDDLMGNTAELSHMPTPTPAYFGHIHEDLHLQLTDQMKRYHHALETGLPAGNSSHQIESSSKALLDTSSSLASSANLPTDKSISRALRSYRDRYGTKRKPIGIVKALKYLLQDVGVPISLFGEYTYTSLMTCCRTPAEARRIIQMMKQAKHPVSKYSWSILVDIHAKLGDYQGCVNVMNEMVNVENIPPTLPAYTSLLAACYKVCSDGGRISKSDRAEAAKVGWDKWQEMFITGIKPDAMAYGAMLRLCAVQGHAERAFNLLEEMHQTVGWDEENNPPPQPTTLCFTSALRAIAKSQAIAVRFEQGNSRRNKRRETIASHHGKLARQVVIMAENDQVPQDDGFIAALIMCAAEAGDLATAKAILTASQIRTNLNHLRTIGSNEHLARLRGEEVTPPSSLGMNNDAPLQLNGSSNSSIVIGANSTDADFERLLLRAGADKNDLETMMEGTDSSLAAAAASSSLVAEEEKKEITPFQEREYGKDSRVFSALLHACARAVDGTGDMWQGRENDGFLCENSLRLIVARKIPLYKDREIPDARITDDLQYVMEEKYDREYREGKRKSRKFEGYDAPEGMPRNLDDLDPDYEGAFVDKDGRLLPEYQKTKPEDVWRMRYGKLPTDDDVNDDDQGRDQIETKLIQGSVVERLRITDDNSSDAMFFDSETMRWKTRDGAVTASDGGSVQTYSDTASGMQKGSGFSDRKSDNNAGQVAKASDLYEIEEEEGDLYFDKDEMRWKARTRQVAEEVEEEDLKEDMIAMNGSSSSGQQTSVEYEEEMYFDKVDSRWKTRMVEKKVPGITKLNTYEAAVIQSGHTIQSKKQDEQQWEVLEGDESEDDDSDGETEVEFDEEGFQAFYADLQEEVAETGSMEEVDEEEARELFLSMQDEYDEMLDMNVGDMVKKGLIDEDDMEAVQYLKEKKAEQAAIKAAKKKEQAARESRGTSERRNDKPGTFSSESAGAFSGEVAEWNDKAKQQTVDVLNPEWVEGAISKYAESERNSSDLGVDDSQSSIQNMSDHDQRELVSEDMSDADLELAELRKYLPAFSETRLKKIRRAYRSNLGDPSLLELVPIVRESMPDNITGTWLKQNASLTARYVLGEAAGQGLLDRYMMNSALEVETSTGSLSRAAEFHATEFQRYRMQPTQYSDRLVLQMFLKNNRLGRALAFKDKVQKSGRTLDLAAYGSFIQYCARRGNIGSAMLILKECLATHGSPPGEASLANLRIECKRAGLEAEIEALIGKDPIAWLKRGEAELRREYSYRGQRDVNMVKNAMLRL